MRRTLFLLTTLLLWATTVYSQNVSGTRVTTQFGYDIYRSGILAERHLLTQQGETITYYPELTPAFSGQWTVNGVLCTAEQILQGGNPTICSADATLHKIEFYDSTKTFATYYRPAGSYGRDGLISDTTGGHDVRGYVSTLATPAIRLAAEGAINFSDTPPNHVPYVLVQAVDFNGGFPTYDRKLFSACTYTQRNICDIMDLANGSQVRVSGGLYPVTIDDGAFDVFALGTVVLRTRQLNPGTGENNIGTIETPGIVLQNPIATRSGGPSTVEYAPSLDLQGSAWNSSGNQTELDTWRLTNRPVSVAGTTTSIFCQRSSINNSSFTDRFCVTSAGLGTLATMNMTASQQLNGVLMASATAPTIASAGCTSPAVTWNNGTAAFLLTLGSSCTGVKTIVLTLPAAAHFWHVNCDNNTSDAEQAANALVARATSTTAVTITNYSHTTGLALDFTAGDTLLCDAHGG